MSKIIVGKHVKFFGKVPWLSLGQNTKVIIKFKKKKLSPDFFKDIAFHVSFHIKLGYMRYFDFSIDNPQKTCSVT